MEAFCFLSKVWVRALYYRQRAKGWISPQNIPFILLLLLGGTLACWPVPTELSEGERVLGLKPEEKLS